MSTSLIAVFIPILLMGGIVGKLFREFAVTLSAWPSPSRCWFRSPPRRCCARSFSSQRDESRHGRIYRISENAFQWLHHEYNSALRWVLRHQRLILCVAIGTAFLNVYLFIDCSQGLFSAAGHRPAGRPNHGRAGHQLPRHARQAAPTGADDARRSGRAIGNGFCAAAAATAITWASCSSPSSRSTSGPVAFPPTRW